MSKAGFREREHTADWALEVWAPGFVGLLEQAARGVEHLSGTRVDETAPPVTHRLSLPAEDAETALVEFLNELLFLRDVHGRWYRPVHLAWDGKLLQGELRGFPIAEVEKEVKAATYHNLHVSHDQNGWRAVVVLDV